MHADPHAWARAVAMSPRIALALAAAFLFAAVGAGAIGAHALRTVIAPDLQPAFASAVQYHFVHALGLLGVGILLLHKPGSRLLAASGCLLVAGLVLFCGTLYFITLTGNRAPSLLTPVGGVAFLAAWATLAAAALRW
jgi:uncharacterized membrane protein YgdD (TMEM256/DUF423 family)